MGKLVYGVGINDVRVEYKNMAIVEADKHKYIHKIWRYMLRRSYSDLFKKQRPSYIGVTVCEEWHTLSNFKSWMIKQEWKGKELDKDMLYPGNKIYSPNTCIFIDHALNSLMLNSTSKESDLPMGVHFVKERKKFRARIRVDYKKVHLGYFKNKYDAGVAYANRKIQILEDYILISKDDRLIAGLNRHILFIREKKYD